MGYPSIWSGNEAPGTPCIIGCGVYAIIFGKSSGALGIGPAPPMDRRTTNAETGETVDNQDILDEIIYNFKANVFMKTFELKGPADRVTLYVTLYLLQCLKRLQGVKKENAKATLLALAVEKFSGPGEAGFPFTALYPSGFTPAELQLWKDYMKQLRLEVSARLPMYVYAHPTTEGLGNVHWMVFSKYTFLEAALEK